MVAVVNADVEAINPHLKMVLHFWDVIFISVKMIEPCCFLKIEYLMCIAVHYLLTEWIIAKLFFN